MDKKLKKELLGAGVPVHYFTPGIGPLADPPPWFIWIPASIFFWGSVGYIFIAGFLRSIFGHDILPL